MVRLLRTLLYLLSASVQVCGRRARVIPAVHSPLRPPAYVPFSSGATVAWAPLTDVRHAGARASPVAASRGSRGSGSRIAHVPLASLKREEYIKKSHSDLLDVGSDLGLSYSWWRSATTFLASFLFGCTVAVQPAPAETTFDQIPQKLVEQFKPLKDSLFKAEQKVAEKKSEVEAIQKAEEILKDMERKEESIVQNKPLPNEMQNALASEDLSTLKKDEEGVKMLETVVEDMQKKATDPTEKALLGFVEKDAKIEEEIIKEAEKKQANAESKTDTSSVKKSEKQVGMTSAAENKVESKPTGEPLASVLESTAKEKVAVTLEMPGGEKASKAAEKQAVAKNYVENPKTPDDQARALGKPAVLPDSVIPERKQTTEDVNSIPKVEAPKMDVEKPKTSAVDNKAAVLEKQAALAGTEIAGLKQTTEDAKSIPKEEATKKNVEKPKMPAVLRPAPVEGKPDASPRAKTPGLKQTTEEAKSILKEEEKVMDVLAEKLAKAVQEEKKARAEIAAIFAEMERVQAGSAST